MIQSAAAPTHSVRRCYADFAALDATLRRVFLPSELPALPPEPHWFRSRRDPTFLKTRFAALSLYVDALGLWDPLLTCPLVRDFLATEPLSARDAHDPALLRALAASWDDALLAWLAAQFDRVLALCLAAPGAGATLTRDNAQRLRLLEAYARRQAATYRARDDDSDGAALAQRCTDIAQRCADTARLLRSGALAAPGSAAAVEVAALEHRFYALLARSESCFDAASAAPSPRAARRLVVAVHSDTLALMREMVDRRAALEARRAHGGDPAPVAGAIATLDNLQQETADFEAAWSKRAAAFLAALEPAVTDKDQVAATVCGDVSGAGTSRASEFSSRLEEMQERDTDSMFEL